MPRVRHTLRVNGEAQNLTPARKQKWMFFLNAVYSLVALNYDSKIVIIKYYYMQIGPQDPKTDDVTLTCIVLGTVCSKRLQVTMVTNDDDVIKSRHSVRSKRRCKTSWWSKCY